MRTGFCYLVMALLLMLPVVADASPVERAFAAVEKERWKEARRHAAKSGDSLVQTAVQWFALTRSDTIAGFDELARFVLAHPDWPEREKLLIRSEIALLNDKTASRPTIQNWFRSFPPRSARGRLIVAELAGTATPALVRETWVEGDFSSNESTRIRKEYANWLRDEDHAARASRLLWERKSNAARALRPFLAPEDRLLLDAKLALVLKQPGVDAKIGRVPSKRLRDPGLIYERLKFRAKRKNVPGVRELLLAAPEHPPYPATWWKYRKTAIREALETRDYALAERLAGNHGQTGGGELAEALWLKGWIALVFRAKEREALLEFQKLHGAVAYPISRARAAYWAGRAAKALGDGAQATGWFKKAAVHPTSFYGQLAREEVYSGRPLALPRQPVIEKAEVHAYLRRTPLAQLVMRIGNTKSQKLAWPFIRHLVSTARSSQQAALAARLGVSIGRPDFSVKAAKEAAKQHYVLLDAGWPVFRLPPDSAVEAPLALAIMRQESLFNPQARSSADARGMMQLLPSTARLVARKHKLPYKKKKLYEAAYNVRIGSRYLAGLTERFGGSYMLAAAGYNAGPSRPRSWQQRFGAPGGNLYQTLNWIEMIPFYETRNYVQRVLENHQIYRWRLSGGQAPLNLGEVLGR